MAARKGVVSETFVSYSPLMPNGTSACSTKRTDSKNGPYLGRFGRKTAYEHLEKNTLFCTFSRFCGFLRLQVVAGQNLPEDFRLQKKSCQKTYRRVFIFGGFW
jgi:hypothetical protein